MFQTRLKLKAWLNNSRIAKQGEKTSKQTGKGSVALSASSLLFKIIVLSVFAMIVLFPFYYMISGSLMSYDEISDTHSIHLWPQHLQWSNFTAAFSEGFWDALWYTALITIISIVLKIIVTMLMGYAFSLPKWRGKKLVWWIFLSIMMLPEVALMSGQFRMVTTLGWREGSMLIASLSLPFIASVFSAMMFKNAFSAIPLRTKEAAMIDGASEYKYFFKVALPMISPTTWTVGILTAFAAWNSYMWPQLLLGQAGGDTNVMSTWLFTTGKPLDPDGQTNLFTNVRLAAAIIAILPMLIAYFGMRNRIMKAISRQGSAIKG